MSIIEQKGPSLPVQIARMINVSPLFTSVFLSELKENNKLKTSHMKVGSSAIFYIQGQEAQLENFVEHLNQREKEAFFLIKKSQVLEDDKQPPVVRVAIRAIKDFATPLKISSNNAERIFWKYHLLGEKEFDDKVRKILNPLAETAEPKREKISEKPEENKVATTDKTNLKEEGISENISSINQEEKIEEQIKEVELKPKQKKQAQSEFADKIKDYLLSKDIEILASIVEKKKEFTAKIRVDTIFGKQEYYLIAKDKKKINETDITLALQKAQTEKMLALILSPGEIDKKASPHIKEWRNLIKFEKIRF